MTADNPLIRDRDVRFLLFEVFDAEGLCELPYFADHSRETFELLLDASAKLAREQLFPHYRAMDTQAAFFENGRVRTHPAMEELWPRMVELGLFNASRPYAVGGQQLPNAVGCMASTYLMAANLSAFGFGMLTAGAAHLIEAFGSEALQSSYMQKMAAGEWTGTMALTEPQAGSSLADVQTRARPGDGGHYLLEGNKVFISGGDNSFSENVVHLVLARIVGAPAGIRGVSLFVVPRLRLEDGKLVDNDAVAAGSFHKLGWRAIPSIALNLGERGDCHGYLVGEPHQGIRYMFQMMNEARLHIGAHGIATASAAYHEALEYARSRPQGRAPGSDPEQPQTPIVAHPDVRRMLLRQKAIVEGGLSLCTATAFYVDLSQHAPDAEQRRHAQTLLDLLTPITKSFPAEYGFESNALAVQVHGGYGYTSEYLPEAWLRDQKLNSIHEGTTGIQGMDLLGRKLLGTRGQSFLALDAEVEASLEAARSAHVPASLCDALSAARTRITTLVKRLLEMGAEDPAGAMLHSHDFLTLMSIYCVAWQWLRMAAAAQRGSQQAGPDADFYAGKLCAAEYWCATELPRVDDLAALCESVEDSYAKAQDGWF